MRQFEVVLQDRSAELIDGADVYQQEGTMTTFFSLGDGREIIDCWADRVASVRTADVLLIRRLATAAEDALAAGLRSVS
jgi:hypothetical protein